MDNLDEEINRAAADAQDVAYHDAAGQTAGQAANVPPHPVHTSSSHRLRNALIATVILVLAGAAVATWYFLLRPTPERILGQMVRNMQDVKAYEYGLEVKGSVEQKDVSVPAEQPADLQVGEVPRVGQEDRSVDIAFSAAGTYDAREADNPHFSLKLDGSVSEGDKSYDGAAEVRFLEDTAYLQLAKAPEELKPYVAPFLEQWIRFEGEPVDQNKQALTERTDLSEDQWKEIGQVFSETGAVTLEYKGTEDLDGDTVDVIGYRLDKDGLKEAVAESYRIVEGEEAPQEELASLNEAFEQVTFEPGTIMVDRKTKLLRKATLGLSSSDEEAGEKGTAEVTITVKNYDDEVGEVAAPEESVTFEELTARMSEDADKDGLTYEEEITYGSDPSKRDTDGDSFPDGAEVKGGYNPAGPGFLKNDGLGSGLFGI